MFKEINILSKDEKIKLVQEIWDSISDENTTDELTDGQRRGLDEVHDQILDGALKTEDWNVVKERLLSKL
ncbi:addiction module protein [Kamptonema cortianum]|nr:addiction module protein [Oscillatoria laete-virens]MDK3159957.1 addiction module protein [Kamptonema cortianum]MDL5047180.1 addiction module protein [Oscillatoria amoena NRMC-F 0135]MDL5055488.1 addiction module protein [Oscillatoria laete-virens NRMC-F 0139]